MLLFHASKLEIPKPDIHHGRKNADFGWGFYLTPDREFAHRWSRAGWVVNKYEFDDEGLDWGMTGGDTIIYLNNQGYESYSASVDPAGSAWDRACELYAELYGTRVDYGEAHSRRLCRI